MSKHAKTADLSGLYPAAIRESFVKLKPRALWRNPVIFVTAVAAAMTTVLGLRDLLAGTTGAGTSLHVSAWLWLCVLFANFAEALAEGRGKARADTLRATKSETRVRLLSEPDETPGHAAEVLSTALRPGQYVHVAAGEIIPTDGEAVRGVASVNESAITGESAPVIRESGGDRSGVTGGTTIVSDWLVIRVTAEPGNPAHRAFYQDKRDRFRAQLATTRLKLLPVPGGYFQLVDYSAVSDLPDLEFARWLTQAHGVTGIPLSPFYANPPAGQRLLRLCFAKNEATVNAAVERLSKL